MKTTATAATHEAERMFRIPNTELFATKSWSAAFQCPNPDCGNVKRFNLNFLGRKIPICNGYSRATTRAERRAA